MKNYIIFFILAILFSGCGLFKNRTIDKNRSKIDSAERVTVSSRKIDKSQIVISEKIDTMVQIRGYQQSGEWKLNPGQKFPGFQTPELVVDSSFTTVKLYYDSLSHAVKVLVRAKDTLLPVNLNRTTTIHRDVQEDNLLTKDLNVKKASLSLNKKSEPSYEWVWYLAAAALFIFLFWTTRRREEKGPETKGK